MSLHRVVDALIDWLAGALDGVRVGDVAPTVTGDLPCAVLAVRDVQQATSSVGRIPRGTRTGALPRTLRLDLADPVLDLGDGERLTPLSTDRRTLTLPHGPLVAADGTDTGPLTSGDLSVDDGAPFAIVSGSPSGRQVRADPLAGTLLFGVPPGATGTLTVTYRIGQWDTVTTRLQGLLTVDVSATTATETSAISRRVSAALAGGFTDLTTGLRLRPRSWESVQPAVLDAVPIRTQRLGFGLDAELEDPVLTGSGGVITAVDVHRRPVGPGPDPGPDRTDQPFEPFEVRQGASR